MATAETARLIASLELQDKFSPGVSKITASVNQLERSTGGSTGAIGRMARGLQGLDRATGRTQRSLSQFGRNIERGVVIGAAATVAGIGAVVRAASDYESAFAGVRKTVSATEPELKALSDGFRQLSREIPISASELARLGEAGGALGVPTAQLKEFVRVTALLGVTTNLTSDAAADSLGILGNVLHLTEAEYSKFASALVALGNAGASTESDIIQIAQRAGAAGELIGLTTEQVLGLSSAVASLGIEVEAGGSSLQTFFIDVAKNVATGKGKLDTLAKTAGLTSKAFKNLFEKDAGLALQKFLAGLGKLDQAAQLDVLDDLDQRNIRITRTLLGLANNTGLVADQMGVASKAFAENTALTKEAEQRFNTFESQVQITKNVLTDMAITIGSKLLPKITPLLKRLNDFVGANQDKIGKFGDDLASGFEKFANEIGKINFKPIIDGLRLSAEIAGKVITIFRSLPGPLQAALVGGFALNKVTGGLPTSIAKDIGGVLIKRFAERGSSPANPLFVADVAGGLGKGAGLLPAAGAGLGSKVLGLASKVFIVGMVAEVASLLSGPVVELGKNIHTTLLGENNPLSDFGKAWTEWQQNADWPFGQKNAPEWAGGKPANTTPSTGGPLGASLKSISDAISGLKGSGPLAGLDAMTNKLLAGLKDVTTGFKFAIGQLKENRDPKAIENAMKSGLALISKGRGNISDTKGLIAGMKAALKNVHDPKLRASLQAAINKVEARLPARSFAARQLAKADALIRDGKITNRDLKDLKSIERALKDRGLPHAASVIREKIATAQHAQVEASRWAGSQAASAIRAKRWQFTTNVTVNTEVSIKNQIRREHQLARVSAVAS